MSEASAVQPGILAKVYRNTGTYGSPTWAAIGLVRNVSPSAKWDRGDASIRATRAKLQEKTQIAISGTIECRADPADAGYQALFDAAMGDSTAAIDLMIIGGPITQEGVKGVRGYMNLDFEDNHSINEVVYTTFAYDPAWNAAGYPAKVEMGAASTPTLTQY